MTFCSSSKVAVFSLLTIDVDLCLNMSEDLNQIYCRRSLDMNGSSSDTQNNQNNSSDKVNTSQILENDATEPDNSSSLANNSDNSVPLTILTKSNEDYNNKLSVSGTTTY